MTAFELENELQDLSLLEIPFEDFVHQYIEVCKFRKIY